MKPIYVLWGKVRPGKKRGKELGFPTANISLHRKIPEGVYAAKVKIDSTIYIAAAFIGAAETFHDSEKKAESYILDFRDNIYGKWMTMFLYKQLRGNHRFSSPKELRIQIEKDIIAVRSYFS